MTATAGTSGEPRKVVLYYTPDICRKKLTVIALARTYNMRVSKDTVHEQHVYERPPYDNVAIVRSS